MRSDYRYFVQKPKQTLKCHTISVHNKIREHFCELCRFKAAEKRSGRHFTAAHDNVKMRNRREREVKVKAKITESVTTLPKMEEGRNSRSDKAH